MTPKEKARELVDRFLDFVDDLSRTPQQEKDNAKDCALICVDEMIDVATILHVIEFLEEVKKEINKL